MLRARPGEFVRVQRLTCVVQHDPCAHEVSVQRHAELRDLREQSLAGLTDELNVANESRWGADLVQERECVVDLHTYGARPRRRRRSVAAAGVRQLRGRFLRLLDRRSMLTDSLPPSTTRPCRHLRPPQEEQS